MPEPRARGEVIESYLPLVRRIARHFSNRGEQVDDLVQVGAVAMIRAVDRCDPERAGQLTAYVSRCVDGELRRHLRDHSNVVRVPRRLQRGDQPGPAGREALVAPRAGVPLPLDEAAEVVTGDAGIDEVGLSRALVWAAAGSLNSRERRVVALRYFLDLSQAEIGEEVGVSQVHVSRLLRRAIGKMRAGLEREAGFSPR